MTNVPSVPMGKDVSTLLSHCPEAQLVPEYCWPLAVLGQRAPEANFSPGCPGEEQRKQAVLQKDVSGRNRRGRPRLKGRL